MPRVYTRGGPGPLGGRRGHARPGTDMVGDRTLTRSPRTGEKYMPSLLDLTSQGDVGTISDESKLASVTLMTPQQLYELWERQNWQSHTIDLTQDARDWQRMDAGLRSRLAWNLSSFFVGEERVTTQFSGLVMAYDSQS